MRVNIEPQWKKLANWYWDTLEGKTTHSSGMSIWDMLYNEYGAMQAYDGKDTHRMVVIFPDEQSYSMFLLRWA